MFKNKRTKEALGIILIFVLLGFVGWYLMQDLSPKENGVDVVTEEVSLDALVESGDAKVEEIPVDLNLNADTIARPSIDRKIVIPDRFPPEAVTILENNIETLTTQLKEDPNSFELWSNLAAQYKIIDDFSGAVEIWEYLSLVAEENIGSRINLGNVYHYNLKEFEKSESVFKDVLRINDKTAEAYTGLYELYKYSHKTDTTLAIDVLKNGIVAIPENIDLRMLLASYYTELGMKDEANTVYAEVLTMAQSAGNANLVTIIEAAIEDLK